MIKIDISIEEEEKRRNILISSRFGSFLSYIRCAWSQFDFIIIIIQCHAQSFSYSIHINRKIHMHFFTFFDSVICFSSFLFNTRVFDLRHFSSICARSWMTKNKGKKKESNNTRPESQRRILLKLMLSNLAY
jgi:hypothetical protein